MLNLLIVGQSHVAAFRSAAKARREHDPEAPRTRTIHLGEERYAPALIEDESVARFGEALVREIDDQIGRHTPRVASCIGGNVHNALALLRHPRPFDFILSGVAEPQTIEAGAEPVPEDLVRAALMDGMADDLVRLRLLASRAPVLVHLQSPPPLASDAQIAERADAFFQSRGIAATGVASNGLRRRMWLLQSRIMAEACAELGIPYLSVPPQAMDADGFLRPDLSADATHGNGGYGEIWIRTLEAL